MAMAKAKRAKYRYEKILSVNLRYGTKVQRKALLDWVNLPKFGRRKPTPDELVAECRRKGSPLYGLMKPTQKRAAETYWRQTAQDIIRHIDVVRVDIKTSKVISKPVRAWVPIKVEQFGRIPEESYIPTQRVPDNPLLKQTILERAHNDFLAWMQRYERYSDFLQEFSPVINAYKRMMKRHGVVKGNGQGETKPKRRGKAKV